MDRKSIFITGAASGMGRSTAVLFSRKGWFIGAADINEDGLKALKDEIGKENCFTRKLDVTDFEDYKAAIAEFGSLTNGRLDLLYNNAGTGRGGFFEDISYENTMRIVQINLVGVLNGIYAALPLLKATPNALCFTTSSSSATYGMPTLAVYSATKHAVKGLTEALSIEFMRHGIRAADVLPAAIDTPLLLNTPVDSPELDRGEKVFPKKGTFRLLPPEEVAETVWKAYNSDKLHWYVPPSLAWFDRIKGISPEFLRKRLVKMFTPPPQKK
jgi:NAD(P)-dependent dehydrogenase (short-subunit alcohol dehydrogenase family)